MGNLFFQIWAFLVQMILLNIFVAILMDGYAEAQEEGAKMAEQFGRCRECPYAIDGYSAFVPKRMNRLYWISVLCERVRDMGEVEHIRAVTFFNRPGKSPTRFCRTWVGF